MKKILYTLIIFMMFMTISNAAKCVVINGTGKNIGDEVTCGKEHFYVVENNGEQVKMLSKYNLNAGITQEKIEVKDKDFSTEQEFYDLKVIKEKLDQGYTIYDTEKKENSDTTTVVFRKYSNSDNKTLIFEQKNMTIQEYLKREDVQELLNKGYYIDFYEFNPAYFDNEKCEYNKACTYDIYGGDFIKSKYYDSKVIVFDEPFYNQDPTEYLNNHEEYKKLLDEGWTIGETYKDYIHYSDNEGTHYVYLYSGLELRKTKTDFKEKVYQSEKALGAIGNENRDIEPIEIGLFTTQDVQFSVSQEERENVYFKYFYDYDGNYSDIFYPLNINTDYYLEIYNQTLKDDGFNILNTKSLTAKTLYDLTKNITGKELPLVEWQETAMAKLDAILNGTGSDNPTREDGTILLGSLKELIPEKYSWLWKTTYWIGTGDDRLNYLFIDTMGDLCTVNFCSLAYGAGLRPLVTISSKDLIYNIKTKTDGNGTIESTHIEAGTGELIKFTVKPKEGYVLGEVRVIDENGNIIKFTDYSFTMPTSNVIIEATFKVENAETVTMGVFITCCLLIIIGSVYLMIKNTKDINWLKR